MTFGSLFSGIGGIDLGLERAGMVCKWQVEIDDFCQKVLTKHWPNVPKYKDVREVGKDNLETVDLIAGGFPCQDVSCQGLRAGIKEGTRSGLWYDLHRIVREINPKWVIIENVKGLLSINSGRGFGRILYDLASIGYNAEWACFPASAFGAHHKRYRIFIVAYPQVRDVLKAKQTRTTKKIEWGAKQSEKNRGRGIFENLPKIDPRLSFEPYVDRVAYGIPNRMDRLKSLGNAVVPQMVEWIGKNILTSCCTGLASADALANQ